MGVHTRSRLQGTPQPDTGHSPMADAGGTPDCISSTGSMKSVFKNRQDSSACWFPGDPSSDPVGAQPSARWVSPVFHGLRARNDLLRAFADCGVHDRMAAYGWSLIEAMHGGQAHALRMIKPETVESRGLHTTCSGTPIEAEAKVVTVVCLPVSSHDGRVLRRHPNVMINPIADCTACIPAAVWTCGTPPAAPFLVRGIGTHTRQLQPSPQEVSCDTWWAPDGGVQLGDSDQGPKDWQLLAEICGCVLKPDVMELVVALLQFPGPNPAHPPQTPLRRYS